MKMDFFPGQKERPQKFLFGLEKNRFRTKDLEKRQDLASKNKRQKIVFSDTQR